MNHREIDALIAEKVMRWKYRYCHGDKLLSGGDVSDLRFIEEPDEHLLVKKYSTRLDHAWEVVEKLRRDYHEVSIEVGEEIIDVEISTVIDNPKKVYCAYQEYDLPLAICKAALGIMGYKLEGE